MFVNVGVAVPSTALKAGVWVRMLLVSVTFAAASAAVGCSGDDTDDGGGQVARSGPLSGAELETAKRVIKNYADVVYTSYKASHSEAVALDGALDGFVSAPSATTMQTAKDAWLAARTPYGQTEGYRFYGGPIDDEDGPEGQINAWPMDELYIDYVAGMPDVGIINDPATHPNITKASIAALNEVGGEANVATGYHAIEFLLWGQDLNQDGPGERPFTDYVTDGSGTAANQDRRGAYVSAASKLLVDDLQEMVDAWEPDKDNYRKTFEALDPGVALTNMLQGMGFLSGGELSGERMNVAYTSQEQEDEHSCFSDNTHNDILYNAQSIQNVYLGNFGSHDGPGIDELVEGRDPELNKQLKTEMTASIRAIKDIPVPFDSALQEEHGREKIKVAIDSLRAQTTTIAKVAELFDLKIVVEE